MSNEMTKHTPTPFNVEWREDGGYDCMYSAFAIVRYGRDIAVIDIKDCLTSESTYEDHHARHPQAEADALFLCHAANAHDALVGAALWALREVQANCQRGYAVGDVEAVRAALRGAGVADEGEVANVR